jgi:hypothetical protein
VIINVEPNPTQVVNYDQRHGLVFKIVDRAAT